jgi:hypothetical protein
MADTKSPFELAAERRYPGKSSTDIAKELGAMDLKKAVDRAKANEAAAAAAKLEEMKAKAPTPENEQTASNMKKGGKVKSGGRGDGCCVKGKTKGRFV